MKTLRKRGYAGLQILTRQLRAATAGQLSLALEQRCRISASDAKAIVAALRRRRLVATRRITATVPQLDGPLARWRPGSPPPDFDAVAWVAQHRLSTGRPKTWTTHWATGRGVRLVGGVGGRLRKPLQVEHDLGVAAMFVARAAGDLQAIRQWVGEDLYVRDHTTGLREKIPDAVYLGCDGRPDLVVDFISRYPARRLREFHEFWSLRRVRYEWW